MKRQSYYSMEDWNQWADVESDECERRLNMFLTIDGTGYDQCEVSVDPYKTIRQQINDIIRIFELPVESGSGYRYEYIMGLMRNGADDESEPEILSMTDDDGHELSLKDYGVVSGDHIAIIGPPPLYGSAIVWPIPLNSTPPTTDYLSDE